MEPRQWQEYAGTDASFHPCPFARELFERSCLRGPVHIDGNGQEEDDGRLRNAAGCRYGCAPRTQAIRCSGPSHLPAARRRPASVALALTSDHVAEPGLQAGAHGLDGASVRPRRADRMAAAARQPLRPADGRRRLRHLPFDPRLVEPRRCRSRSAMAVDLLPAVAVPARVPRLSEPVGWSGAWSGSSSSPGTSTALGLQLVGMMLGGFGAGQRARDRVRAGRGRDAAARSAGRAQRACSWSGSACWSRVGGARAARCAARRRCWSTALRWAS